MSQLNTEISKENRRHVTFDDFRKLTIRNGTINFLDVCSMKERIVPFTMSSGEFKSIIKNFDYESIYATMPKWDKNNGVERIRAVPFAYHYYSFVAKNGMPPSPSEFVNSYVKDYINCYTLNGITYGKFKELFLSVCSNNSFILKNMKSRILRAYNSFNRELALLIMLQELAEGKFEIMYDIHLDMDEGMDIIVEKGDSRIGIATFVNTFRANTEKDRKRKSYNHNIPILDYAAENFGENKNVEFFGDVMLYSTESVKNLAKELEKKLT